MDEESKKVHEELMKKMDQIKKEKRNKLLNNGKTTELTTRAGDSSPLSPSSTGLK